MTEGDENQNTISESEVSGGQVVIRSPTARFSVSEHVDYHVVLDQELTQLSRPEAGMFGAFGFAFFGAAIGFMPQALATLAIITKTPPGPVSAVELWTIVLAPSCFAASIACLAAFGIAKFRNRGVENSIRQRPKTIGTK
jgi:hypothetical protein